VESFSIALRRGSESERFNDAFYRFLELNCIAPRQFEERCGLLTSTPIGPREEKVVTLWSREALGEFVQFWRSRQDASRSARQG
jgi:hypothetical protein